MCGSKQSETEIHGISVRVAGRIWKITVAIAITVSFVSITMMNITNREPKLFIEPKLC